MKTSDVTWALCIISNDEFLNHRAISKILKIEPSGMGAKGKQIRKEKPNLFHKDSFWEYRTPTIETFYAEEALESIYKFLLPSIDELSKYVKEKKLYVKFYLKIEYYSDSFPGIVLDKEFIDVCHKLDAEVDQDIYIFKD
jgi:hypothetical protein